jgi:hypothetical protein
LSHPKLAPLATQENDRSAAEIRVGDAIQDEHLLAASVQYCQRKVLHKINLATEAEVLASKEREARIMLDRILPNPVFNQMIKQMNDGFNQVNKRLNGIEGTVKKMDERLNSVEGTVKENQAAIGKLTQTVVRMEGRMIPMSIQIAKNTNRTLGPNDTIVTVPNLRGEFSPEKLFPRTQGQIATEMQAQDVEELLRFYGVDFPRNTLLPMKKSLLYSHLGLVALSQVFQK